MKWFQTKMDNQPTCVTYSDGTKSWHLNGEIHREDGPAVEISDGSKEWWINGNKHRNNGPAVEYPDGEVEWWFNGICYDFKYFLEKIENEELKLLLVLKYEGVKND